jgi:hypothetical protein
MRDTYYQSPGNPVQFDRLPTTEPDLQLLAPRPILEERWGALSGFLTLATASVIATLIFYQAPGISWLEPYDLLFAWPALIGSLAAWIYTGRLQWLLSTPCLASAVFLAFNHHISWGQQIFIVSCVTGLLVYAFGWHWSAACTTAPVSRTDAELLRQRWHPQFVGFAVFTGLLVAGLLWTGALLFHAALLVLPAAALLVPTPQGLGCSRYRVIAASLSSWFTYEAQPLPGLFQSPVGGVSNRWGLMLLAIVLTAAVLNRWPQSPLVAIISLGRTQSSAIQQQLSARHATYFEQVRYEGLNWLLTLAAVVALPIVIPLCLAVCGGISVSLDAAAHRNRASSAGIVSSILSDRDRSTDPTERCSLYLGRVVADGSPALVPRLIYREHAHGLGDSGCGKTALFLCPTIEQLGRNGDCSIIVIDLKADSLELLASLRSVADTLREKRKISVPVKVFSNQSDKATFAFNPLTQPFWQNFDDQPRTDILCGANGLTYGTDYGAGFYSSANAAILYHAIKTFPHVTTFTELANCIGEVITTARKRDLHPETRKAGVHVQEVMKRLAACEALNVTHSTSHDPAVVDGAIDLSRVFQEPQFHYYHLSSTLSPSGAPEIGRLVTYMLLAAATQTKRDVPVFLAIDEFQRMVANNLEYMLQLARSMGVGVILANQSMEDLKKGGTNLIPAVEANCRLRQWFSVSCSEDQERIIRSSGQTVDYTNSWSDSTNSNSGGSTSHSLTETVAPRININDILLMNDHPFRSILRISRGAGYAQYGGMPVIIESEFHISPEEYRHRRALPWPTTEGTFVPRDHRRKATGSSPVPPTRPEVTSEVIDVGPAQPLAPDDREAIDELFRQFKEKSPPPDDDTRRPQR